MEEPRGRTDLAAYLYIAGGIPAMIVFFVVLFVFAHTCGIHA